MWPMRPKEIRSGVVVGVGSSALSQGYDRGWSDDGPGRHWGERFDGPRWSRDDDGRRGWFGRDGDGPRGWFRRGEGPRGWHEGGLGGFGGQFLTPGRIERIVNRLGWAVDASSEQKQKITGILQKMADDLAPMRQKHQDARRQIRDELPV